MSDHAALVGKTLNHYRVVELLGRGGMGEVFVAEDTKLNRRVALKLLLPKLAGDPERRQRFAREAQAVAALNHPNIVTIHSVEESDAGHFITMELVAGRRLSDIVPGGGLPLDHFLRMAIPLADALSAAHQKGVIHRDLKPSNIMVGEDGRVKVLDFGLAKLRDTGPPGTALTQLPTEALTDEGRIVGTVAYMSPEQAEGKPIDERSDIFSLGIIFYEMATGERPFKGDTSMSLISSILKDTPRSVTELNQALPRHLGRIIKRALSKDTEHRYQTAKDLRNDLEELKAELDSGEILAGTAAAGSAATARDGRRRLGWMPGAAALAIVVLGVAIAVVLRGRPATAPAGAMESIRMTRLTNTGTASRAVISPDGRYVVHVVDEGDQQSLWVRQVATSSNVPIVPAARVRFQGLTFSPDADYIYYVAYAQETALASLFQVPVLGGTARKVLDDLDSPVTFSPDGRQLAFMRGYPESGQTAIFIANTDGTGERKLATRKAPDWYAAAGPAWSPDGKVLAIAAMEVRVRRTVRIVQVETATGRESPIGSATWLDAGATAWLADGSGLVAAVVDPSLSSSAQIVRIAYPAGDLRRITNDLNQYIGVSLTADSRSLVSVQRETQANLYVLPGGDSARSVAITTSASARDGVAGIDWTPDGRIVHGAVIGGAPDLFIVDADGRNPRQLTSEPASGQPVVAPDGRTIAFVSDRTGKRQIWRIDIDGGHPTQLTHGDADLRPVFTPDGGSIVFYSFVAPGREIWKVGRDGGEPHPYINAAALAKAGLPPTLWDAQAFSPDGRSLAMTYYDPELQRRQVAILDLEGRTAAKRLTMPPADFVRFTPDGQSLTYLDSQGGVSNVWNQPIDGGPPRQMTRFTSDRIFSFAWSRDGKRLALSRGRTRFDVVLISNLH